MSRLQEWIHRVEEGEGAGRFKQLVFFAVFAGLALLYDFREFKNFSTPEAMDAAQLARNLAGGRGFTTQFIRPLSLTLVAQQNHGDPRLDGAHPDLANPPLYPLFLAGLMKVLPFDHTVALKEFHVHQPEMLIAIANQILFLVALGLLFRLARKLFDEPVAWVATLLLAGADLCWRFSISGLSTLLLMVIFLALVSCLAAVEQGVREHNWSPAKLLWSAVLAGILTGLGALTRYSFAWLALPVAGFFALCFPGRRWPSALLVLVLFTAVLAPWLMRNYTLSGRCFGLAGYAVYADSERFPGNRLERALDPVNADSPSDLGKFDVDEHLHKLGTNLAQILQNEVPRLGGSWAAAFFLAGLLVPFHRPALKRLRLFLLASLAVLAVAQALGRTHLTALSPEVNSENLLVIMAPLVFLFGAGMFALLADQLELSFPPARNFVAGTFILVASLPLVFALWGRVSPLSYPPYYPPVIVETAGWMAEDEVMMSDMPWAVAWYGRRQCLWLTWDVRKDFTAVSRVKPVRALYLTPLTLDGRFLSQLWSGSEQEWGRFAADCVVKEEIPDGFPLKFALDTLFPDQLFLTDRARWKNTPK